MHNITEIPLQWHFVSPSFRYVESLCGNKRGYWCRRVPVGTRLFLHLYIICTLRRFDATHEALGINLLHNERAQRYVTEDCSAQASVTAFV